MRSLQHVGLQLCTRIDTIGFVHTLMISFLQVYFNSKSKSINAFFDGFVNAQTPLSVFFHQYDTPLAHRR